MNEVSFAELDINNIKNYFILLDVDGTIINDGGELLDEEHIKKIKELKQNNEVHFCSNKSGGQRLSEISGETGVSFLDNYHRKPSRKILQYIKNDRNLPLLVIGDKFLIDGLFAKNIGAKFIKVKRVISLRDSWHIKLIYLVDDVVFNLIKIWII